MIHDTTRTHFLAFIKNRKYSLKSFKSDTRLEIISIVTSNIDI